MTCIGNAAFQEIAQRYQDDRDSDGLFDRIFDYMEYNFGPEASTDMYRYLPSSLVDAYKQRQERRQHISDLIGYINYEITKHNSHDPEAPLTEVALSKASGDLWVTMLEQSGYGGPYVSILATELTEAQERHLQRQLFPGQPPGFEGYTDFSGVITLLQARTHDYSLRDRQTNHWTKTRMPDGIGGSLEASDYRKLDYDAFTSYFACRFMDHGPSRLQSVAYGAIATEAVLQSAHIPYTARVSGGRDSAIGNIQLTLRAM